MLIFYFKKSPILNVISNLLSYQVQSLQKPILLKKCPCFYSLKSYETYKGNRENIIKLFPFSILIGYIYKCNQNHMTT